MNRTIPFDPNEFCDICHKQGAYDFMGDHYCESCLESDLQELDEFHFHEMIDRLYSISTLISEIIETHPVYSKYEKIQQNIDKAQELLIETYNFISNERHKLFPDPAKTIKQK